MLLAKAALATRGTGAAPSLRHLVQPAPAPPRPASRESELWSGSIKNARADSPDSDFGPIFGKSGIGESEGRSESPGRVGNFKLNRGRVQPGVLLVGPSDSEAMPVARATAAWATEQQ